jgi:hypothetical protein
MPSRLRITINGVEYIGKTKKESLGALIERCYEDFDKLSKANIELANGKWLLMNKETFGRCTFIVEEVPAEDPLSFKGNI